MIKRRIYLIIRKQEKKRNSDSDIIKMGGWGRSNIILGDLTREINITKLSLSDIILGVVTKEINITKLSL